MLTWHTYVHLLHSMHHGIEVHAIIASVHHPTCHELLLLKLLLLLLKIHSHHVLLIVHSYHRRMHSSSHRVALILGIHHRVRVHIRVHIDILHHHRITCCLL